MQTEVLTHWMAFIIVLLVSVVILGRNNLRDLQTGSSWVDWDEDFLASYLAISYDHYL